jgi:hypothetical protein
VLNYSQKFDGYCANVSKKEKKRMSASVYQQERETLLITSDLKEFHRGCCLVTCEMLYAVEFMAKRKLDAPRAQPVGALP